MRQLLLVPMCYITYMASWTLAMPHFWAVNSNLPTAGLTVVAIATIIIQLIVIDQLIRVGLQAAGESPAQRRVTDNRQLAAIATSAADGSSTSGHDATRQ